MKVISEHGNFLPQAEDSRVTSVKLVEAYFNSSSSWNSTSEVKSAVYTMA